MITTPQIYTKHQHSIIKDSIDPEALKILEILQAAGFESYLVGGGVRDLLLGHHPKDFDISTSAKPEEVRSLFRNCILIGRRFRLAHIRFGRKVYEVSTFRSGDTGASELVIRDNEWGSAQQDAMRRDFSLNGLYYDPSNESIIDYVGGYEDLQKNLIRVIGIPQARFKQDPVRMLRLVKFRARFGFEIDEPALQALLDCKEEILKSSGARLLEEIFRMLESGSALRFFTMMADFGLLQYLLPSVSEFFETTNSSETFAFLEEIDAIVHDSSRATPCRAILLSSLVFPMMQKHMNVLYEGKSRTPNLGEIQKEARFVLQDATGPFLTIPKRTAIMVTTILTSQYRLTPMKNSPKKRILIPRIPDFHLALEFLDLRSMLEPGLKNTRDDWYEAAEQGKMVSSKRPFKRRRRYK